MSLHEQRHKELTVARVQAFLEQFGCQASAAFPHHEFTVDPDEDIFIDVFVFTLETQTGDVEVAVTNGLSDERMVNPADPAEWSRRELIQYFPKCTKGHAQRLRDMAWLPRFDRFLLDAYHSVAWNYAAVEGTPWKNAFFLAPLIGSHREFEMEVEGDPVSLLWHVPISEDERAYKQDYGADALIDRMQAVNLPWVFDEQNRPSLLSRG